MEKLHIKLYIVWAEMKQRCNNPKHRSYMYYGDRGIKVCDEWQKNYTEFEKWAFNNGYKQGLSLDRIDNNKGYSKENCRWVNWKVQQNNRNNRRLFNYMGVSNTLIDWARILNIKKSTLAQRLYVHHWSVERAFSKEVRRYNWKSYQ